MSRGRSRVGMVLGKFMPPHEGHLYLCRFAAAHVDRLFVVVEHIEGEPIPSALRHAWMQTLMPGAEVLHLRSAHPQAPEEHPDFWGLWRRSLLALLPEAPDLVFASEAYGPRLAAELGARFVMVDPERSVRAISGTQVRQDPLAHFDLLPGPVRAHYALRVSVFGPESTGKSTLSAALAQHFGTVHVPEYARTYLESVGRAPLLADLLPIARGQLASTEALAPLAQRVLISDTDALATQLWSQALFGEVAPDLVVLGREARADLTLLLDVDVPWVKDDVRYLPDERHAFFRSCAALLTAENRPTRVIRGDWATRQAAAIAAVEDLIAARRAKPGVTMG